jgi:hypothetical protein
MPEASMILSTLPDLPGRSSEVRGLVCAQGTLMAIGGASVQKMMQQLAGQAEALGADGVVDADDQGAGDHAEEDQGGPGNLPPLFPAAP